MQKSGNGRSFVIVFSFCAGLCYLFEETQEVLSLRIAKLLSKRNPPCPSCPYKLGIIRTPVNPCPQCEQNGYKTYEHFKEWRLTHERKH